MISFFDTHLHIDEKTDDSYIQKANESSVHYLMTVGADLKSSLLSMNYAQQHDHVWFAAGLHPHDAANQVENSLNDFLQFKNKQKLLAIGEIGLDYFYNHSDQTVQKEVFHHFLNLALDWDLPAIIHCRDQSEQGPAYNDCLKELKSFAGSGGRFVVHCFSGSCDIAQQILDLGGYLGITGMVTFAQAHNIREIVTKIPLDRLLLETDTPWLAPVPFRGKPNHSCHLPIIAQKISDILEISKDNLAIQTTANAFRFLNIIEKG